MLKSFFRRITPDENWSPEKIASFIIPSILTIIAIIWFWPKIDRVPATAEDYKTLNDYLESIQGKPDDFFNMNGDIFINEDRINYKIENDECKMTGIYNKSFELVGSIKEDKAVSTLFAVLGILILSFLIFFLSMIVIYLVIAFVELFIIEIILLIKANLR